MQQLVRTTLNLEQYKCQTCGRLFYINQDDKTNWDIEFGCPYGCDDAGKRIRTIHTEIKRIIGG